MSDKLLYDLDKIRNKMKSRKSGGSRDPNEWRPDKADIGKTLKWKFFVLPPVKSMDLWYYEHGAHWIDKKTIECPRVHDGSNCPLCQFGFDLMKDADKATRSKLAKEYLASARYAINIYWPNVESTPQDLRGKVMWFSMPQSIYAIMEEVIMRDAPLADDLEPEAHGIFFDPNNAYPFVLEARKKGDFNSYESSHFINKQMPISKDENKVLEILEQRHDIPTLFDSRDPDALQNVVNTISGNSIKSDNASKMLKEDEDENSDSGDDLDDLDKEIDSEEIIKESMEDEITEDSESENEKADLEDDDADLNSLLEDLNS